MGMTARLGLKAVNLWTTDNRIPVEMGKTARLGLKEYKASE